MSANFGQRVSKVRSTFLALQFAHVKPLCVRLILSTRDLGAVVELEETLPAFLGTRVAS